MILRQRQRFYAAHTETILYIVLFFSTLTETFKLCNSLQDQRNLEVVEGGILTKDESNTRIVGGNATDEDRYSYLAIIGNVGVNKDSWSCGGTLIAPDVILTAAHCVGKSKRQKLKMGAQIGRYDITDRKELKIGNDVIEQNARRLVIHPDRGSPLGNSNDVALMFFPRKFQRSSNDHEFVNLDVGSELSNDDEITVIGWGSTNAAEGKFTDLKREAVVTYDTSCGLWDESRISDDMFCADSGGEADTCSGDSGGPAIIKGTDDAGDVQIGVTSWGGSCADPEYPGVYAKVSDPGILNWIFDQVCRRSSDPPSYFDCGNRCFDSNKILCRSASERKCRKKRYQKKCCNSCEEYE